ncbi:MAG: thioredoxin family protein, partial [Gammaproteobacteria bacterium]|nr:thioredoxin family protein [Gammaproteobacteria bacterium]
CDKNNLELEIHYLSDSTGKDIAAKHNLKSFPALIINEKVVAVGHPSEEVAKKVFVSLKL